MTMPTVRIHGFAEAERKLGTGIVARPISRFMRSSGFVIMNRAKLNTRPNMFEGNLIGSFAVTVAPGLLPRKVTISNNAEYAPYLEKGTRPHWPPISAITPWAVIHNWNPYLLARHISRVGTKAHPFLEPALRDSMGDIKALAAVAAREIESLAGTGL
jgi:hypothetical protein